MNVSPALIGTHGDSFLEPINRNNLEDHNENDDTYHEYHFKDHYNFDNYVNPNLINYNFNKYDDEYYVDYHFNHDDYQYHFNINYDDDVYYYFDIYFKH